MSLVWPASIGIELISLEPKPSVKVVWKLAGPCADSATVRSLPLSLPTVTVYSKAERGVPRSDGRRDLMLSLAGASVPTVSVSGSSTDWAIGPLALIMIFCEPGLASFGTSTRSCRADVLVDARHRRGNRLAAAQDVDLPAGRHVLQRQRHRLGRQPGVGELQPDGRDLAGAHGLRGIVRGQEQALGRVALGEARPGDQGREEEGQQGGQATHRRSLQIRRPRWGGPSCGRTRR